MAGSSAEQDARAEHSFRSGNPVKICVRRSRTPSAAKPRYFFHSIRIFTTYRSPNLQSVQGRTPARGNRMFPPRRKGGVGGIPPTFARARATDSSHTSHRLLGGVSRRQCPPHTTVICGEAAINPAALAASFRGEAVVTYPTKIFR